MTPAAERSPALGGVAAGRQPPRPFEPLAGATRLAATFALALAAFMNILDLTIANVSVPTIAGAMGVSATQGTWIVTSYAVSEAIMLPLTGWFAARLGQRRMFMLATTAFTLASLLCALSLNFPMLLAARVAQGAVGAAMIPLAQAMLLAIYPPAQRGLAMGIFAMTTVAAPIVGPLAGGWITDHLSWHWIFLVNLPVGALCLLLVWSLLGRFESTVRRAPVDLTGMALLALGVGSLQILLDKGNELDWFGSPLIVALATVSAVALTVFVVWTLTARHPVVELRLFARRNYAVGVGALALASVAFFGTNVVVPLWLQTHMGYTAEWAGRTMAFGGLLAIVLGPVIGANIHRLDARAVATFGLAMFALFAWLSSRFPPDVDFWTLATTRLIMGVGLSCLFLPLTTIYLSGLAAEQTAGAAGLANFMRNIGSSFGTSIMTSLWAHRTTQYGAQLAESVNAHNPAAVSYLDRLAQIGLAPHAALVYVQNAVIGTQASLLATNAVLLASALLMLGLIAIVWLARPPFSAGAAGAH
ncbi:MAG: DHA2 family efflux MFS transporter permease subunit [Pseudomonadota bacterium]|uniref:DHA2 family efflux MFS transporter permease subunit n=1 Tax=Piscinibacter defluvii TaxID=1796922 RepID=UPI000FDD0A02|nr:DHA2 family efflux MFS transporter permease subunit [Piscinibacter defluvii]